MPLKVCLSTANTFMYPQGGHLWVFINWALGLKSCGCDVTWLDVLPSSISFDELSARYKHLRKLLLPFDLHTSLVADFFSVEDSKHRLLDEGGIPSLESFAPFDLLVDLRYNLPDHLFRNFRRTILINIDPGRYEMAVAGGAYPEPKHDLLFSIGEGHSKTFLNRNWHHTPPCVFLPEWPFRLGSKDAPWTTVAHWWAEDHGEYDSKRESFGPFMTIPSKVCARFELALNIEHKQEQERIEAHGFKVRDPHQIVASPLDYRFFIQHSAGEFSCAKPSYVKGKTAWISDRTPCYLASGKPCVVQDTGPSNFLPTGSRGLHRFSDLSGAIAALNQVMENYESEAQAARLFAEEFFDAHKVCASLLTRAL